MKAAFFNRNLIDISLQNTLKNFILVFCIGLIGTLGFAPFHQPGLTLLSIAGFYGLISHSPSIKNTFYLGLFYGLGYFGSGVSWVLISIHDYGNLNYFLSIIITFVFLLYLSTYSVLIACGYQWLARSKYTLMNGLLFAALWCLADYLRSTLLTGFPWLLVGTTQINSPLKWLMPVIGLYGTTFVTVFLSSLLIFILKERSPLRYAGLILFVLLLLSPLSLQQVQWTQPKSKPVSVGIIQANLAMRDKWDDALFWNLLTFYKKNINALLGKDLIVLPESAIPLPASYLNDYLSELHYQVKEANSALILGILQPKDETETQFYNAIISLGRAKGTYQKEHLVPFGEYIPHLLKTITNWLALDMPGIVKGKPYQKLIQIKKHPVASLICYEMAYPSLLRKQMPLAEWIVSISDDGWFGHSLASYQQQQMGQVLSLLTGRYQIMANNDGLSSIISPQGEVLEALPAFSAGILASTVYPVTGNTPWIEWGDYPILLFCFILILFAFFSQIKSLRM